MSLIDYGGCIIVTNLYNKWFRFDLLNQMSCHLSHAASCRVASRHYGDDDKDKYIRRLKCNCNVNECIVVNLSIKNLLSLHRIVTPPSLACIHSTNNQHCQRWKFHHPISTHFPTSNDTVKVGKGSWLLAVTSNRYLVTFDVNLNNDATTQQWWHSGGFIVLNQM